MKPASSGPDCPRCGGGFPAALSPETLEELASQSPMPASLRAGESLLRRRLACCSGCDSLREQVLCAQCGCFVRFRAAVLKSWCPSPAGDKWAACSRSAVSPGCAGGLAGASLDLPFSPNPKTEFALDKIILSERSIT